MTVVAGLTISTLISSIAQVCTVADWLVFETTDVAFLDMCALIVGGGGQWLYLLEMTRRAEWCVTETECVYLQ